MTRAREPATGPAARTAAAVPDRTSALLAMQRAAGNRAVAALLRQPAATPLTADAARRAAADVNKRYDQNSIRGLLAVLQRNVGTIFTASDAQALAQMQQAAGLPATGALDDRTLDKLLSIGLSGSHASHSLLIHLVVDHADLDVSAAGEIVFDDRLTTASEVHFAPGGVPEIRVGAPAFASSATLLAEIRKQLAAAPPATGAARSVAAGAAAGATGAAPALHDARPALAFDRGKLTDRRAIRMVQGSLGVDPTGRWDTATVRRIAASQQAAGRTADGKLDDATVEAIVTDMVAHDQRDAAIALIIDFYKLDRRHAFDVTFVPTAPANRPHARARTLSIAPPGTSVAGVIEVYPLFFQQPFAGMVDTLAHELGHIEQNFAGLTSEHVREFLGYGIQVEAKGLPQEAIESPADIDNIVHGHAPVGGGLISDVAHVLEHWRQMTPDEQAQYHGRYTELKDIALDRINAEATPDQQQHLRSVINLLQTADAGVP